MTLTPSEIEQHLAEATALLKRSSFAHLPRECRALNDRREALLSRAPAQPAALVCHDASKHVCSFQPAAPEPSREREVSLVIQDIAEARLRIEELEKEAALPSDAEAKLAAAENELRRIGYGVEPIYVFAEDGRPQFTSLTGDVCWDTRENRAKTFAFITAAEAKLAACKSDCDLMQAQKSALSRRVLELEEIKPLLDALSLRAAEAKLAAALSLLAEISESGNTGRAWRGAIRPLLAPDETPSDGGDNG